MCIPSCNAHHNVYHNVYRNVHHNVYRNVYHNVHHNVYHNVKCILYVQDVQLVEIDPSGVGPVPYGFRIKKAKKTGPLETVSLKTVSERVSLQTGVFGETVFSVCGRLSALNT